MAQTRFEKLQEAIKAYGAAAFENLLRCKGFGEAVVKIEAAGGSVERV